MENGTGGTSTILDDRGSERELHNDWSLGSCRRPMGSLDAFGGKPWGAGTFIMADDAREGLQGSRGPRETWRAHQGQPAAGARARHFGDVHSDSDEPCPRTCAAAGSAVAAPTVFWSSAMAVASLRATAVGSLALRASGSLPTARGPRARVDQMTTRMFAPFPTRERAFTPCQWTGRDQRRWEPGNPGGPRGAESASLDRCREQIDSPYA